MRGGATVCVCVCVWGGNGGSAVFGCTVPIQPELYVGVGIGGDVRGALMGGFVGQGWVGYEINF